MGALTKDEFGPLFREGFQREFPKAFQKAFHEEFPKAFRNAFHEAFPKAFQNAFHEEFPKAFQNAFHEELPKALEKSLPKSPVIITMQADIKQLKEDVHEIRLSQEDMRSDMRRILDVVLANTEAIRNLEAICRANQDVTPRVAALEAVVTQHVADKSLHRRDD